jgi:hypothetical protein
MPPQSIQCDSNTRNHNPYITGLLQLRWLIWGNREKLRSQVFQLRLNL